MNIAPISEPNTMIPAQAATQKTRRPAMWRSYSGFAARRWRRTNAAPADDRDHDQAERQHPLARDRQRS